MHINIKGIAVCFIILLVLCSAAATVSFADEPRLINTQMTCKHKNLFKIPVYIVPEPGMNFAETQDGCADKVRKVSLNAVQIRVSYNTLLEEFNGENLKKAGLDLKLRSEFIWNGTNAVLLKVFQDSRKSIIGKWILIIDRGEETWMITGLYEAKDSKRSEAVLNMLKSVWWNSGDKEAALSMPLGNIDTEGTQLRLAGLTDGMLVYTRDGVIPTKSDDGSLFVISRQQGSCVGQDKQSRTAKERLGLIERGKKLQIISENNIMIDGLHGIELIACTEEEPKDFVYQTLLFDYKDSHALVGIARGNIPENLEMFHKLAESYKQSL